MAEKWCPALRRAALSCRRSRGCCATRSDRRRSTGCTVWRLSCSLAGVVCGTQNMCFDLVIPLLDLVTTGWADNEGTLAWLGWELAKTKEGSRGRSIVRGEVQSEGTYMGLSSWVELGDTNYELGICNVSGHGNAVYEEDEEAAIEEGNRDEYGNSLSLKRTLLTI